MMGTVEVEAEFRDAMRASGVEPPGEIVADGDIHRFALPGERGKKSGAYRLYGDGRPAGWFQSHKGSGGVVRWSSGNAARAMDSEDMRAFRRECSERKRAREQAQAEAQARAARKARAIPDAATGNPASHAYALLKGVSLGPLVKRGEWAQNGWTDALLVPLFDAEGKVASVEAINGDGEKRFLKDGRMAGAFYPMGKLRGASTVLIGEGMATVAAGAEATRLPALVAMSANNLLAVARIARDMAAPGARLVIIADNDIKEDGTNPGVSAAEAAARAVGAVVALPVLGGAACDLWDIHDRRGPDAVRALIESAKAVEVITKPIDSDVEAWLVPQPIPDGLLPVPAFDIGLLPEPLASWVADVAERTQCPPEFPAVGMLVAIGSALGRRVAVRPNRQDDWHEFANLWGVIVGAPGVLKSPALSEALKPLRRLESVEHERHDLAMNEWRGELESAKVRRDAAKANATKLAKSGKVFDPAGLVLDDTAEEPHAKRYIVNDTSPEALGVILSHNPQGVLAHRDEVAGLLASMEREGNEGARQFYLSACSGKEPYQFDRITRGVTRIEACCVAMLGTIQPAILARHIRDAAETGGGDGLLSRFSMLVWPDMPGTWRDVDRWPNTQARQAVNALFDRIAGLDPATIGAQVNEGDVPAVRFSAEARDLFIEWRGELEQRLRAPTGEDSLAFQAHLAKYRKLVPALALIFHTVEGGAHDIGLASVQRALAWADLLEAHARRAYGAAGRASAEGARALLAKLRSGAVGCSGGFTLRDVYQKGWSMIDTRERAAKAADLLTDLDYLRAATVETGGRPTTVYTVNPNMLP